MESAHWERVHGLFHAATALRPEERLAFLRENCGGDEGLVEAVLALLEEDGRESLLLDRDLGSVADDLLGGDSVLPQHEFGPYRIRSVLGEGGMGVVYLGVRDDLGSRAAIKVLRNAWLSPARRARFAAEQRTLAQLQHHAIAQLLDAGSLQDGTPWFAMEFVEGVPLTEYCSTHETSIEGRLELFRAVCEAVQYAHGQAIIHRDLKPSNILVKADGTVKLLDFGIAKHLEFDAQTVDQTRTGLRLLTPAYASPEQLRGERLGIRTDVFSLGVILYELLAQRVPFELASLTPLQAASTLLGETPERPSAVAGTGPRARSGGRTAWADLDVLCLTAMQADSQRRYSTVEALIRDVDHFLAGDPLEARADTLGYRLSKFVRRNRVAVSAACAVLVAVLALVAFYTLRLTAARNSAEAEAARVARIQSFMLSLLAGGDEEAGPAADLRILTLLERGVQEARTLNGEPVVQAELYQTLGSLYSKLGEFDRAEELLSRALDRQRELFADKPAKLADTLVLFGLLRMNQARFEDAEHWIREGLQSLRGGGAARRSSRIGALTALGQVLEARGDYPQAIAVNDDVVRLCARDGEDTAEYAAALGQLADSHFYAGHYEVADELNQAVLDLSRRIHGDAHPRVADVLINLGASQGDRGRYAEAEAFYRSALSILEAFHGSEHFRTASARTMLGRVLVYQGRLEEGVVLLESALVVQERVHGPVHPRVASALNDLGSAALQDGRLDEAEARFRRMLAIYAEVYPEGHYLLGIATSNLASVLTEKHDDASAEQLYREAIAIYERTLSATHLNTGIGRIKLGRALLNQARYEEAERETSAGYEILRAQATPSVSWLRSARADLVAEYEALGEPARAQAHREE